jgi:RNA polymerase sigma factor (TIGR02999 family)
MAGERRDHSLQVTALVNEVYIRLIGSPEATWKERAQFFAFSAQLMRNILVDWARSRGAGKRGGGLILAELEEGQAVAPAPTVDLIDLDNAMNSLAAFDARKSRVVELRIFGGLSVAETAEVLKVSIDTVMRDMRLATTWLRRELKRKGRHGA